MARAPSSQRYGPGWAALRDLVFRVKGRACWWCGRYAATVDHVIPRELGGPHDLANLVPACARCNYSRGARFGNRLRGRWYVPARPPPPRSSRAW